MNQNHTHSVNLYYVASIPLMDISWAVCISEMQNMHIWAITEFQFINPTDLTNQSNRSQTKTNL